MAATPARQPSTRKAIIPIMIFILAITAIAIIRIDEDIIHPKQEGMMGALAQGIVHNIKPTMQVLITLIFTPTALFIVLARRYGPKDKHWAYATLGTILGYWLRG